MGPKYAGQFGYIAIEWWPDDYDAIRYAINRGIIVVEAGGNGGQNLDDPLYNRPQDGFPPSWKNPFNPANPSSGAILVGAGNPPSGSHKRSFHPAWGEKYADRSRCYFSNFGKRIDVQGWGWEVTSTGYGDLQGGSDEDIWYTDEFSGTSSASPIVVGALACLQGVLRANGKVPLNPVQVRKLLHSTGSPQEDGPGFRFLPSMQGRGYPQDYPARTKFQRIGNRPNLRQLIKNSLQVAKGN
jgi:subtilisin family serine protease